MNPDSRGLPSSLSIAHFYGYIGTNPKDCKRENKVYIMTGPAPPVITAKYPPHLLIWENGRWICMIPQLEINPSLSNFNEIFLPSYPNSKQANY